MRSIENTKILFVLRPIGDENTLGFEIHREHENTICSEIHTKHENTLCYEINRNTIIQCVGQNVELFNIKSRCKYNNQKSSRFYNSNYRERN
jgi:hypothetical protein